MLSQVQLSKEDIASSPVPKFVLVVCIMLFLVGIAKVMEGRSHYIFPPLLRHYLPYSLSQVSSAHVGIFEIVVAVVLLFLRAHLALPLIWWVSTIFLIYHLALVWFGSGASCNCLGVISKVLSIGSQMERSVSITTAGILFFLSLKYQTHSHKLLPAAFSTLSTLQVAVLKQFRAVWLLLALCVANLSHTTSAAEPFYVSGKTHRASILQSKGTNLTDAFYFSGYFSNGFWKVKLVEITNSYKLSQIAYREIGFDGESFYTIRSLKPAKPNSNNYPVQGRINTSTGETEQGIVPVIDGCEHLSIIWLSFAAGHHLKTNDSSQLTALFTTSGNSDILRHVGFKQRALWQLDKTFPYSPSELTYLSDGNMYSWLERADSWVLPPTRTPHRQPYDKGFTNMHFVVSAFTNIAGSKVPTDSVLSVFTPKIGGTSPAQLHMIQSFRLEVDGVVLNRVPPDGYRPIQPTGPCLVTDMRFLKEDKQVFGFNYLQTNGWLSMKEAALRRGYGEQLKAQDHQARVITQRTTWVYRRIKILGALFLVSLLILTLMIYFTRRRKQTS